MLTEIKDKAFESRYQQILEEFSRLKDNCQPEVLQNDSSLAFKLHSKLYLQELARMMTGREWLEGKNLKERHQNASLIFYRFPRYCILIPKIYFGSFQSH